VFIKNFALRYLFKKFPKNGELKAPHRNKSGVSKINLEKKIFNSNYLRI